jgi:hypothetical protein
VLALEIIVAALLVAVLPLFAVYLRRVALQRTGGTTEVSLQLKTLTHGRGWVLGLGRYEGDDLLWFRVFSLSPRPRRRLSRRELQARTSRQPRGGEKRALLGEVTVVELTGPSGDVIMALDTNAVTGFLAWLEARPPGATLPE